MGKNNLTLYAALTLVILLTFTSNLLFQQNKKLKLKLNLNNTAACTLDAKLCPDGSAVGRIPPDCEFTECPLYPSSKSDFCESVGGTWSNQYNECLEITEAKCESIDGTFDKCASPCRHDASETSCITMCTEVCSL